MGVMNLFDKFILPAVSRIEKVIPPPIGLNLTAVLTNPSLK
jgi:hypothetical protein